MSAERWQQLRVFYDQVLDAPVSERARVLAAVEASHPELHKELLALVAADSAPDSLLDRPLAYLWPPDLSPGDVLCDRFLVERHLGSGGMGDVWAARDQLRDEPVALKTIRSALAYDERSLTRFRREIQLASRVAHPNVCRVHELFEDRSLDPPRLFFTMELLEGETLAARLQRTGALPVSDALQVLRDICAGLDAAHDAGVIHRDLKPANIMMTRRGDSVRVVITDFGLARPDEEPVGGESDASAAGLLVGTPDYMAPEQVRGAVATPATDVYAAGLLLFEMLRGEPPFRGTSTLDSWMRRAREGPQPLVRLVPGATETIDRVLQRCLQYEPERRFQTARELVAALDRRPFPRKTLAAVAAAIVILTTATAWSLRPMSLPREAQQWYDEAQQAVAEGSADRAHNAVQRVLRAMPGFPPAHALLAEIHLELDMPADAVEDMARATQLIADGARLDRADRLYVTGMHSLALRECDSAISALNQRAQIDDASRSFRMVTAARAMERCNRPDAALALLHEAAKLDSRNAAIPLRTARPAARRREYAEAFTALESAESLFRDRNNVEGRTEALLRRGELLAEQDRLDDAEAALSGAMTLTSGFGNAVRQQVRIQIQQAIIARKRGDMVRAQKLAVDAGGAAQRNGLDPLVVEALFASGNIHLVQRLFDAAERNLQDALANALRQRNDEAVAGAHLRLASLYTVTNQVQQAEQELAASQTFYEQTVDTRNLGKIANLRGQLAMARGDYEAAQQSFRHELDAAAREGDPEEANEARRELAGSLMYLGDYEAARTEYATVIDYSHGKRQPVREAYARLNALDALSRMGRSDGKPTAYVEAAAVAPTSAAVQIFALELRTDDALRRWDNLGALAIIEKARHLDNPRPWIDRLECLAAARLKDRRRATPACTRATTQADGIRPEFEQREPYVLLAEARLWLEGADSARMMLEKAASTSDDPAAEVAWRAAALDAATASNERRPVAQEALTRQIDRLRLKWGEAFQEWFRRADVTALTQRALHTERDEK